MDLHIVVNGQLSVREGHRLAHKVEAEVLKALPRVSEVLVHVEPEEELAVEGQRTAGLNRIGAFVDRPNSVPHF